MLLLLAVAELVCSLLATITLALPLELSSNLIALDSNEGQYLFRGSSQVDFWPLSLNWDSQMTPSYCGVATACAVLNSLRVPRPPQTGFEMNLTYFTQSNFFENPSMSAIITKETVLQQGFTLKQLSGAIQTWNVSVETTFAGDSNVEIFRNTVRSVVCGEGDFLIVNYLRMAIQQQTGGHISPIAAYNSKADRVLVLDVAKYKYPPVWIKVSDLFAAMDTVDTVSNRTRGYLVVSTK
jgi:hypothetical protein